MMTFQQRMRDNKAAFAARDEMKVAICEFCKRWDLKDFERQETLEFIEGALGDRYDMANTIFWSSPPGFNDEADMRQRVLEYLEQFAQEMEQITNELSRLSRQARDEKAKVIAGL